jgi:pilus assembly protein Flp/PilA
MKSLINKLTLAIHAIKNNEEGQDLVEYVLVVALIAFAATTAMQTLATSINGAFSNITAKLSIA